MKQKLPLVIVGLVAAFYLVNSPETTGNVVRHAGTALGHLLSGASHVVPHIAHQLAVFLRSL
jgi:hypothetical protein